MTAYDEYAVKAFAIAAANYVLKPFSDERLVVRTGRITHVIDVADIDWIEGADYYARVHCGDTTHLVR